MSAVEVPEMMRAPLKAVSNDGLLDTVVRLTHRVHAATEAGSTPAADRLRTQRDIVRAEILRRMGGTR